MFAEIGAVSQRPLSKGERQSCACESVKSKINEMETYFDKMWRPEILVDMARKTEAIATKLDPRFHLGQLPDGQVARASNTRCYAPLFIWANDLVIDLEQMDHSLVVLWKNIYIIRMTMIGGRFVGRLNQ
jgi:hypothetical protein